MDRFPGRLSMADYKPKELTIAESTALRKAMIEASAQSCDFDHMHEGTGPDDVDSPCSTPHAVRHYFGYSTCEAHYSDAVDQVAKGG